MINILYNIINIYIKTIKHLYCFNNRKVQRQKKNTFITIQIVLINLKAFQSNYKAIKYKCVNLNDKHIIYMLRKYQFDNVKIICNQPMISSL